MNVNGLKQRFHGFWNARNARERKLLLAAATVVLLGLIYSLLIDPPISGKNDLEKNLPALRQQAAEVQRLAREAAELNRKAPPPVATVTRETLEAALARSGLKAQSLTVSGETARVQLAGVSFSALVDWLAEAQRSTQLTVTDAKVEALNEPDSVNASLTLMQQRSGQSQ